MRRIATTRSRRSYIVPFRRRRPAFPRAFSDAALYTVYNMTEIASPLIAGPGIGEDGNDAGLAGMPRAPFELRIVDENDIPVASGRRRRTGDPLAPPPGRCSRVTFTATRRPPPNPCETAGSTREMRSGGTIRAGTSSSIASRT